MNLSKNFTSAELSRTDTGIYNTPGEAELEKLLYLATFLLQPIRDKFGRLKINSGYRSKAVNQKINGSLTSQHPKGEAADCEPLEADIKTVFNWAKDNLYYGQIILETKINPDGTISQWIHISLPRIGGMNKQAMIATIRNGNTIYENV